MTSGLSLATELIMVETSYASMAPSVQGVSPLTSAPGSSTLLSSQKPSSSLGRMNGSRSWIGLSRSLAVVVMMAHVGMRLPSCSSTPT